jgi:hypothetical protein
VVSAPLRFSEVRLMILSVRSPVARKTHTCEWCWSPVLPGQRYVRYAQMGEDGFWEFKACEPCHELSVTVADLLEYDEGLTDDDLVAWAREVDDDDPDVVEARAYLTRWQAARDALEARLAAERGEGLW